MPPRPRILIVEDDLPSAELLKEILEQVQYEVLVANDGAQAVEMAESERLDLAIIDVMLPNLNGFEVCQRIRRNPARFTLPIIMLTVLNESHHRIRAMQAGANDFLTKPFDRLELLTKIRSLLSLQNEVSQREQFCDIAYCLLTALGNRSPESVSHAKRVASLAEQLGRRCGLVPDDMKDLTTGALLHDAGVLALSNGATLPPAEPRTDAAAEWKKHTLLGDLMLSRFNRPVIRAIVRSHHEHIDGTGYPDGLSGEQIPVPVRVVAICNRFDHLTEGRWEDETRRRNTLKQLKEEANDGQWDPAILHELEEFLSLYSHILS